MPAQPSVVERMLRAAPHRGHELSVHTLGHCAVGISGSGDHAETSIATGRGLVVAVCGRIDNLPRLAGYGPAPRPETSPAAAVMDGFLRSGTDFVSSLRGAFAGVVTDGSSLHAFRDHVGFGLLHYREQGSTLYVATEAKQILAGAGLPREPEPDFISGILFERFPDQSLCALRGVRRVPQGSVLSAAGNAVGRRRFWNPVRLLETNRLRGGELKEQFDALMGEAVARVMRADEVIALSGGIDSPAVAAFAAREHRRRFGGPLPALSATYPQFPTIDERAAVELVARDLGLELQLFQPQGRPFDDLRERVRLHDGPAPSSFARWRELYHRARQLGFRTVLSGAHAEFLIDVGQAHLLSQLVRARRARAIGQLFRRQRARGVPVGALARQLAGALAPAAIREFYTDRRRRKRGFGPDWLDSAQFAYLAPDDVRQLGRWEQAQVVSLFLPRLAVEADEIEQAASGVRVRYPWADVDLWEFFLSLRAETKYPDVWPHKLLVRQMLRGLLPDAVLDGREPPPSDASVMTLVDYGFLRELLHDPPQPVPGVNYGRLAERLRREDLPTRDFRYIRMLASIHVFLEELRRSA